jgi:hypothetical protein
VILLDLSGSDAETHVALVRIQTDPTETLRGFHLIGVDDDHFFEITLWRVVGAIGVPIEPIKAVCLLRRADIEKTFAVSQEAIPDGIQACRIPNIFIWERWALTNMVSAGP